MGKTSDDRLVAKLKSLKDYPWLKQREKSQSAQKKVRFAEKLRTSNDRYDMAY